MVISAAPENKGGASSTTNTTSSSSTRSSLLHERLARTKAHRRWTSAATTTSTTSSVTSPPSSNPTSPAESASSSQSKASVTRMTAAIRSPTSPREKVAMMAEHHVMQRKSVSALVNKLSAVEKKKEEIASSSRESPVTTAGGLSQTLNYRRRRMLQQRRRTTNQSPGTIDGNLSVSASASDGKSGEKEGSSYRAFGRTRSGLKVKVDTSGESGVEVEASPRSPTPPSSTNTSPKWASKEKNRSKQEEEREPPVTPPSDETQQQQQKQQPSLATGKSEPTPKRAPWLKQTAATAMKTEQQQEQPTNKQRVASPWDKDRPLRQSTPPPPSNPPETSNRYPTKKSESSNKFVFRQYGSSGKVEPTNKFKSKEVGGQVEEAEVEEVAEPASASTKAISKPAAGSRSGRSAASWIKAQKQQQQEQEQEQQPQQRAESFDFSLTSSEPSLSEPSAMSPPWQGRDGGRQQVTIPQPSKSSSGAQQEASLKDSVQKSASEGPTSPSWTRNQQQQEKDGSAPTSPRRSWRREPSPANIQSESEPGTTAAPPPWARNQPSSKLRASPVSSFSESEPGSNAAPPPWVRQQQLSRARVSPAPSFSESEPSSNAPQSSPWVRQQQSKARASPTSISGSEQSASGPQRAPWVKQQSRAGLMSPSSDEFYLSESDPSSSAAPWPRHRGSPTSSASSSQNQRRPWGHREPQRDREPSPSVSEFTDVESTPGTAEQTTTSGPDWRRQAGLRSKQPTPTPAVTASQGVGKAPWVRSSASWIKPTSNQDHEQEYHDDLDDDVIVEEKKISEPSPPVSPNRPKTPPTSTWQRASSKINDPSPPVSPRHRPKTPPTATWQRPSSANASSYNAGKASYSQQQSRRPPESPVSSFTVPSDEGGGTKKAPEWLRGAPLDSKPPAAVPAWKQKLLKKVKSETGKSQLQQQTRVEQEKEEEATDATPVDAKNEQRPANQRSWQRYPSFDEGSGKSVGGKSEVVKAPPRVKGAKPRPVKPPSWVKQHQAAETSATTESTSPVKTSWQGSDKQGKLNRDFASPPKPKPKQPSWVKQRSIEAPDDEPVKSQSSPTWKKKGQSDEGAVTGSPTPSWKRKGISQTQRSPAEFPSPARLKGSTRTLPPSPSRRTVPPSPGRVNRKSWIKSEQPDDNEEASSEVSSTIETPTPQSVAALRASLQSRGGKVPSPADPTPVVGRVARSQIVGGRPISVTTSASTRSPSPVLRSAAGVALSERFGGDDASWQQRRSKREEDEAPIPLALDSPPPSPPLPSKSDMSADQLSQDQPLDWDRFDNDGEEDNVTGNDKPNEKKLPKWEQFHGEVEASKQPSEWETFGKGEEPSKRSSKWESFEVDDDSKNRSFSGSWKEVEQVAASLRSRPKTSQSIQLSEPLQPNVLIKDPIVTPTQPERQLVVDSPAPPPPPPSTPLTQERVSARQLWKNRKSGADRLLTLPKFKDGQTRPKSIAEASQEDSSAMMSIASETASEIEDRTTFSRLLQMEFAKELEPTIEESVKLSPAVQPKEPLDDDADADADEEVSLANKSLQEMAADSVLIADFHQFREHMERSLNQEDGSLLSSSPARSNADATPNKSDLPHEFQSILGGTLELDRISSPQLEAERELEFYGDEEPAMSPSAIKQQSPNPDLDPSNSDGSEGAVAPVGLTQAVTENIRVSKKAIQASRSERENDEDSEASSAIFGEPDSFGAAGGEFSRDLNTTPNIMDRARAIEQWNGGRIPPRPRKPKETPSRPFDERQRDNDVVDDDDQMEQHGSKAVSWSREPNQVQLLEQASDDSPSSEGDDEPMDPFAGSFPMEPTIANFDEKETEVSAQWHERDPDVDVAGDITIPESPSPDILQTADTADSSEWHISPMVSGVDSGASSPPNCPEGLSDQQELRPVLLKPNSPQRGSKKVSFVDGDVSPSRKGDNEDTTGADEDDPFAFSADPFYSATKKADPPGENLFDPFGLEQGVEVSIEDSFTGGSHSAFSDQAGMMDPHEAMSSPFKLLPPRSSPTNNSRERRQREADMDFLDNGAHYDYSDVAVASSYDPYGEESYLEDETKSEI